MSNEIIQGDCLSLVKFPMPKVDMIFADPPFNIGIKYDSYIDKKEKYRQWTDVWIRRCYDRLKPNGSFWIAINDENVSHIDWECRFHGMQRRNWIIWHYGFGQNCKTKFARTKTHILYYVKHPYKETFNADEIRVPSKRQTEYNDKRANPKGKVPDDVWDFPRVCGTFKERVGWHPCQMPEALLERIIKVSTNEGDLVLDPFSGSGTTAVVAKKLRRNSIGIELSEEYVKKSIERLANVKRK